MAIHKDFADWYRSASITPSPEFLQARWLGVEQAAGSLDAGAIGALLRLYSIRPQSEYKAPEFLDAAFRNHDTTFPRRDHTEELRVLAGAILRQAIESQNSSAVTAALGIACSTYGSRRQSLPTADHVAAAEKFLARRGAATRDVGVLPTIKATPMTKERYDEVMPATVFQANQTPPLRDPLFATFNDQTNRSTADLNAVSSSLWRIIKAQREEINLLWWLQGRLSRDLKRPFSELTILEASLIFPMELADLTVFVPGPSAILGILISALNGAASQKRELTIASAVNATPREWRERRIESKPVSDFGDLCPVLFAITKSLDTDGEADWLPVYRKQCEVRVDEVSLPSEMGMQLYQERLFLRSISEIPK
jgi:hypothetical protein